MGTTKTLGGDRLGSGGGVKVHLSGFERSTHDLSYIWRSTVAPGVLVPFLHEVATPGTKFDIDLDISVLTLPTIGPLFGQFKVQADIFMAPMDLYQSKLYNNTLGIGLDMKSVKLPIIELESRGLKQGEDYDNAQINPSSLLAYLGIRGLGHNGNENTRVKRSFQALDTLMYYDIGKNYYCNKQEQKAFVIHTDPEGNPFQVVPAGFWFQGSDSSVQFLRRKDEGGGSVTLLPGVTYEVYIQCQGNNEANWDEFYYTWLNPYSNDPITSTVYSMCTTWNYDETNNIGTLTAFADRTTPIILESFDDDAKNLDREPKLYPFDLKNIDDMRGIIMGAINSANAVKIDSTTIAPYGLLCKGTGGKYSAQYPMEGLLVKTHQSDRFNNWLKTDVVDGSSGINQLTAISTAGNSFTVEAFILAEKVYQMFMRIGASGGSRDDWQEAVYNHKRVSRIHTPMFVGGKSDMVAFQEVVSNASSMTPNGEQPLGTLAGRGKSGGRQKGGNVRISCDDLSIIQGIFSLTPIIDYSQGNKWTTGLKTVDDLHKPNLDQIGMQDLITDEMAWWDTACTNDNIQTYKSAGKQPSWTQYMTNQNVVRGDFAIKGNQMMFTLNRNYEFDYTAKKIQDLTTYIDPAKFNHIFAYNKRDGQNFWVQIAVNMTRRAKMSAKQMPNL